jgi:hypothetical protein
MQIGSSRFQPRASNVAQSLLTTGGNEIVSLTDKERDEIDFEAKTIIRQTMDRVQKMEDLEKGKHHL